MVGFNGCFMSASTVDELWDFSWYNIDGCLHPAKGAEYKGPPPLLRYAHLEALATSTSTMSAFSCAVTCE